MFVEIAKFRKEERAICTSLDIAETFGKEHKHVLRDVENLGCSGEFNRLNFEPISYTDSMNRTQKAYAMTRDGFTLLVMGYTGDLAMKFKEAYIKQFNAMEAALQGKRIEREKRHCSAASSHKSNPAVKRGRTHAWTRIFKLH